MSLIYNMLILQFVHNDVFPCCLHLLCLLHHISGFSIMTHRLTSDLVVLLIHSHA